MFNIDMTVRGEERVYEPESGISVVLTGTSERLTVKAFLLTKGERSIPFEARVNHGTDPETGEEYRYYTFESFNGRRAALSTSDTGGSSASEIEKDLQYKAAAALVVFGRGYNGLDSPAQRNRVLLNGKLYTRLDFGFRS